MPKIAVYFAMSNGDSMGQKILVTGGAGYIGAHVCQMLKDAGREVVVLDNLVYGHRHIVEDVLQLPLIIGDISDTKLLKEIFAKYDVGAVMHFSAYAYVGESVENPRKYYQNNFVGTLKLLNAMMDANIHKFVFSSTCATYGEPTTIPIPEEHTQNPINPYGQTKLMVEKLLADYDQAYGLKSVVFRYFNAAGADPQGRMGENHEPETHLIPLAIDAALGRRQQISIFGTDYPTDDGTCVRDYIHVNDLGAAHLLGLSYLEKENRSNAFNLGNGTGFSVRQVLDSVKKISGITFKILEVERRAGDPPALIGTAQKAKDILGWKPEFADIDVIVKHAWDWQKKL